MNCSRSDGNMSSVRGVECPAEHSDAASWLHGANDRSVETGEAPSQDEGANPGNIGKFQVFLQGPRGFLALVLKT